jgi:hypothetical protein
LTVNDILKAEIAQMHAFSQVIIAAILRIIPHIDYIGTEGAYAEAARGAEFSKQCPSTLINHIIYLYEVPPMQYVTVTIPGKIEFKRSCNTRPAILKS